MPEPPADPFAAAVTAWYAVAARDLPWRRPATSPWAVLVSEIMLQQTPVQRVEPVWTAWLLRWPTPAALAAAAPGEAVRAWGRLGYPRRALRLHAAAAAIVAGHGGEVPNNPDELRDLPGVGGYTAAAVAAFAFGRRVAVLDTNVRRVHARVLDGLGGPTSANPTVPELRRALDLVPHDDPVRFSVAVMELGALVCTARAPRCPDCPLASRCRWLAAGRPGLGATGRAQPYAGTDRQVRGLLLAQLRAASGRVPAGDLDRVWADAGQRDRALASLLDDGLAEGDRARGYQLPD